MSFELEKGSELGEIARTLVGEVNGVHDVSVDSDRRGENGSDARPADLASESVLPDSTVSENLVEGLQLLDPGRDERIDEVSERTKKMRERLRRGRDELDDVEEVGSRHGEVGADVVRN